MLQQLECADNVRQEIAPLITQKRKTEFGQFMTPLNIARFMASLFPPSTSKSCHLLDAGAGVGALSCAFLDRWVEGDFNFDSVEVAAYEIDDALHSYLARHLTAYRGVNSRIIAGDFVELAAEESRRSQGKYTHSILNPPYKKINSNSQQRRALRRAGIETVNLYSAFVALAVALVVPSGQIVAIIPRSFCNGPYYRPFRDFILERTAIRQLHLFESRSKAFKDEGVLQENLIIRLERGSQQGRITVSTSTDDSFTDFASHECPFEQIVRPDDPERFIHIPLPSEGNTLKLSTAICHSLAHIGVRISTGPVVDFRLKAHLRNMPEPNTVPLLYPGHFNSSGTEWPQPKMKKPNAIQRNNDTERWLYPNGFYCVVRRFSSKEERRRIMASVVNPATFGDAPMLGFENHLNVFHDNRRGLSQPLAYGLTVFLNSSAVDKYFRRFNGHTQVNATDLRLIKYPSRDMLSALGDWALKQARLTQTMIDGKLESLTR